MPDRGVVPSLTADSVLLTVLTADKFRQVNADIKTSFAAHADSRTISAVDADIQTLSALNADRITLSAVNAVRITLSAVNVDIQTLSAVNADRSSREGDFFIDNLQVRIHLIIEMI